MKAPRVTALVDNYNYGRFLRAALDSVLAQGLPEDELEVLVVDDGSTDDSRAVLASYGARVRTILQERRGQAAAFEAGIRAARGEFVCLLDSDDAWLPGKLAAVLPFFEDPGVACVQHLLQDADAALKPLPRRAPDWPARYALDDLLEGRAEMTASSGLSFRRSVLLRCLPVADGLAYGDDYLALRSLFFGAVANVPRAFGLHRVHGANQCAGAYEDPVKLERDSRHRAVLAGRLDAWLREAGRAWSPAARRAEELEAFRRRVLLEALRARPLRAWEEWTAGAASLPESPARRFRLATTLLAVLSPTLYLSLYGFYSRGGATGALRREAAVPR